MNWFWVRKVHQKVQNHTSNLTKDRTSSLFGIPYLSSEFEVEMLEEASCANTHCCKLCVAPKSRTKTALRRFPASAEDFIFFTWWACVKASGRHFEHIIWSYFSVACVHFELTNLSVGFCCVMFMSTVAVLGVFSAWVTIKYHASIWNVCFVANFLCCNIAKYFLDRSTTNRVIAKK